MNDADEVMHFLVAIADLADENGDAMESAVQHRCGPAYRALCDRATDLRYLKPDAAPGVIALTTMGRFAAGALG